MIQTLFRDDTNLHIGTISTAIRKLSVGIMASHLRTSLKPLEHHANMFEGGSRGRLN